MAKFEMGDHVIIMGFTTVLQNPLSDINDGWVVYPAVHDMQNWSEDEMTMATKGEELVHRLYDCDAASALTNEAARFIEGMLKND